MTKKFSHLLKTIPVTFDLQHACKPSSTIVNPFPAENLAALGLILLLLNCLVLFFIHLKLELLTQFPASNDEKYFYL